MIRFNSIIDNWHSTMMMMMVLLLMTSRGKNKLKLCQHKLQGKKRKRFVFWTPVAAVSGLQTLKKSDCSIAVKTFQTPQVKSSGDTSCVYVRLCKN